MTVDDPSGWITRALARTKRRHELVIIELRKSPNATKFPTVLREYEEELHALTTLLKAVPHVSE